MSMEFMSEDVKRMTMLASAMQANKEGKKKRKEEKNVKDKQKEKVSYIGGSKARRETKLREGI